MMSWLYNRLHSPKAAFILLFVGLLCGLFVHINSGSIHLDWQALMQKNSPLQSLVFWELRVPRLITVVIVGAGLAVSGVAMQALFRNPLAEPGLIGVSSSAALGAVFMIVLGSVFFSTISAWQLSLAAFLCAGLATLFIYVIATRYGKTDVALMLLAGVAVNAIAGAAMQLLISVSDDAQLRTVTFWMMGSFANISWSSVSVVSAVIILTSILLWRQAKAMNAFMLGENVSLHMGYDPKQIKWKIMWGSALMVGVAVATVGVIGFVGLVVPHIVRLWVGANHHLVLPLSALAGAVLLVFADFIAKTIIAPTELPIGLFMALLGGPFFLMMLINQRKNWLK